MINRRTLLATLPALTVPTIAKAAPTPIRVSHGFGVLYLPLIVMRELKLLEKHLEAANIEATVSWLVMDGGGAIDDAMLSGALDIAGSGIPGFLTLWSKAKGGRSEVVGLSGLSTCAVVLNTSRPTLNALSDFKPGDKIAVPSIKSSLQAVVLQMLAAKILGEANWSALDNNTVTLSHPNAVAALLSGNQDIAAHLATPPFTQAEAASPKIHAILRSPDILGDITLDMVYAAKRFTTPNPGIVKAFLAAQTEANALIANDPAQATALFIQNSRSKLDPAEIQSVLKDPQTKFDTIPHGFMQYVAFMQKSGALKTVPVQWNDAFVPELGGSGS